MESLLRVRELILRDDGGVFLRLMRAAYLGDAAAWHAAGEPLKREIGELGLGTPGPGGLSLSAFGYVVGNVAKEYCNWLDNGRHMPPPRPSPDLVDGKDVLDLGCGFGRWLWEFQRTARTAVGVEMQREYLELGEALARREGQTPPRVHCASAEDVDGLVPAASMDLVFCRLVMNHVSIDKTLRAAVSRLRAGGTLWLQVETFRSCVSNLLRERRLRTRLMFGFAVVNSALLNTVGAQLGIRARGRMHSVHRAAYPSRNWWRRALVRAGLSEVRVEGGGRADLILCGRAGASS